MLASIPPGVRPSKVVDIFNGLGIIEMAWMPSFRGGAQSMGWKDPPPLSKGT